MVPLVVILISVALGFGIGAALGRHRAEAVHEKDVHWWIDFAKSQADELNATRSRLRWTVDSRDWWARLATQYLHRAADESERAGYWFERATKAERIINEDLPLCQSHGCECGVLAPRALRS